VELFGDGHPAPEEAQEGVGAGVDGLFRGEDHLDAGEDQEGAEEEQDPVVGEQRGARGDEGGAEDESAEDAVEEDAVLVEGGDREEREDDDEDEDVVERERLLDEVAGEELEADLAGGGFGVEAVEREQVGRVGELPGGVAVEAEVEGQGEGDPDGGPEAGFAERDGVGLAVEDTEVEGEHGEDEGGEAEVEPPVFGKREEGHRLDSLGARGAPDRLQRKVGGGIRLIDVLRRKHRDSRLNERRTQAKSSRRAASEMATTAGCLRRRSTEMA